MLSKLPAYYLQENFRKCKGRHIRLPQDINLSMKKKTSIEPPFTTSHINWRTVCFFSIYYLHFFAFKKMQWEVSLQKYFQICTSINRALEPEKAMPFSTNKTVENRQYSILRVYMNRNKICCATQTANRTLEKHLSHLYQWQSTET